MTRFFQVSTSEATIKQEFKRYSEFIAFSEIQKGVFLIAAEPIPNLIKMIMNLSETKELFGENIKDAADKATHIIGNNNLILEARSFGA